MKKRAISSMIACMMLAGILFAGCSGETPSYYPTTGDVTVESILEVLDPMYLLEKYGSYEGVCVNPASSDTAYDGNTMTFRYHKRDQFYLGNQFTEYDTGEFYHMFFSSEPADEKIYIYTSDGCSSVDLTQERLDTFFQGSVLGIDPFDLSIVSRKKKQGMYLIRLECQSEGRKVEVHDLSIDPNNGLVMEDAITYFDEQTERGKATLTLTYGKEVKIDKEPRYAFEHSGEKGSHMTFKTVDLNGNSVDLSTYSDAKILMVEFWEPWCEPCQEEMPVLEALYEKYHDQGLEILGVFSSFAMEEKAREMTLEAGITYPILKWHASLQILAPEFRPAVVFLSTDGTVLSEEPIVGAQSMEKWEEILSEYLS